MAEPRVRQEQGPARRQGTDAGDAGRFLDADGVQASPRTGHQTALGEALDIPTARSVLSALPEVVRSGQFVTSTWNGIMEPVDSTNMVRALHVRKRWCLRGLRVMHVCA